MISIKLVASTCQALLSHEKRHSRLAESKPRSATDLKLVVTTVAIRNITTLVEVLPMATREHLIYYYKMHPSGTLFAKKGEETPEGHSETSERMKASLCTCLEVTGRQQQLEGQGGWPRSEMRAQQHSLLCNAAEKCGG